VGREVAVKIVNPDLAGSAEFVRGFAEEARVVAGLEHPHIVPPFTTSGVTPPEPSWS
jgi:serine/threonine-protein kinase